MPEVLRDLGNIPAEHNQRRRVGMAQAVRRDLLFDLRLFQCRRQYLAADSRTVKRRAVFPTKDQLELASRAFLLPFFKRRYKRARYGNFPETLVRLRREPTPPLLIGFAFDARR
jgi:hypothetical protein